MKQTRLKELLSYNSDTGLFTRLVGNHKGKVVGTINSSGYCMILVDGQKLSAHRLACLYVYGTLPKRPYVVDHIDRDRSNNRIGNLRVTTQSTNVHNSGISSKNTSGTKGVSLHPCGKWVVRLQIEGKRETIGYYGSLDDAIDSRKKAEIAQGVNY